MRVVVMTETTNPFSILPTSFDSKRSKVACRRKPTRLNSKVGSSAPLTSKPEQADRCGLEYMKALVEKFKEDGKSAEEIKQFQTDAAGAAKKILGNWENYDVYQGESMAENGMYVLVDFREDGMTPYATVWKAGLKEYKV